MGSGWSFAGEPAKENAVNPWSKKQPSVVERKPSVAPRAGAHGSCRRGAWAGVFTAAKVEQASMRAAPRADRAAVGAMACGSSSAMWFAEDMEAEWLSSTESSCGSQTGSMRRLLA